MPAEGKTGSLLVITTPLQKFKEDFSYSYLHSKCKHLLAELLSTQRSQAQYHRSAKNFYSESSILKSLLCCCYSNNKSGVLDQAGPQLCCGIFQLSLLHAQESQFSIITAQPLGFSLNLLARKGRNP